MSAVSQHPDDKYDEWDSRRYGVAADKVVAIYIGGTPWKPDQNYPSGFFHSECLIKARALFMHIDEFIPNIKASSLNWANPYHCEACEESIT